MTTALESPLVGRYLSDLERELSVVAPDRAVQIRASVVGFFDKIQTGADEQEFVATISRLGPPARVIASGVPRRLVTDFLHLAARWVVLRSWRFWSALVVMVVLIVGLASYAIVETSVASLRAAGSYSWLPPIDDAHSALTDAGREAAMTNAERFGQRQGILIDIINPSRFSQRVTGVRAFGVTDVRLDFSTTTYGFDFTSSGLLPAGAIRQVRLSWISNLCLTAGAVLGIGGLDLRVRTAGFTRTQHISFLTTFLLSAPTTPCPTTPAHG
jgi:hypothetical protein